MPPTPKTMQKCIFSLSTDANRWRELRRRASPGRGRALLPQPRELLPPGASSPPPFASSLWSFSLAAWRHGAVEAGARRLGREGAGSATGSSAGDRGPPGAPPSTRGTADPPARDAAALRHPDLRRAASEERRWRAGLGELPLEVELGASDSEVCDAERRIPPPTASSMACARSLPSPSPSRSSSKPHHALAAPRLLAPPRSSPGAGERARDLARTLPR